MPKFVNVRQINFRNAPTVTPSSLIGPLYLGQEVTDLGGAPPGWEKIRADVEGKPIDGFVVATIDALRTDWKPPPQPVLRDAASPAREALVAAAVMQWTRFARSAGKEYQAPYDGYIGEMWKAFGLSYTGQNRNQPWSAVAISLMARTAAATFPGYLNFKASTRHSVYIMDAIKKGASKDVSAPFWAERLPASRPQVGDIIANWRQDPDHPKSDEMTFDDYLTAPSNPGKPSHTDIVVAIGPNLALALGGNVSESVSITGYQLGDDGSLYPNPRPGATRLMGGAIAVMVNRVK